jgi:CBS domain-containing protein
MQQRKQNNHKTKVKDLMTSNIEIIPPDFTLKEAAQKMEQVSCGVLPVGTKDSLEGIITDRDIVLRAVAKGEDVNTAKVENYMTAEKLCYCSENDTAEDAAELMRKDRVNRLLVKDESGRLSGIITFGRIIREDDDLQEIANVIQNAVGEKKAA